MTDTSLRHGNSMIPVIQVRVGQDPDKPHMGTLAIDDWTVPCAIGRGGLVQPNFKREGDGATPIGCFPLRYGFFDPTAFAPETFRALDFPFVPKPKNYDWSEDGLSPLYNRFNYDLDPASPSTLGHRIFDMFIPIGWNDSVAAAFAGSAIYLHIAREDFTPTAGCVVIAHDRVLELARRMQPGMMIDIALAGAKSNTLAAPELRTASAIEIVSFRGMEKGPKIIVTGAVHGDEPAGPRAITRLISEIRSGAINLLNGSITFVPVINSLAWRRASREGDRNLNRYLSEKVISHDNEDRVGNILCPLLREHDVLIDLHSFAGAGDPMVLVGPSNNRGHSEPFWRAEEESALAVAMGLPLIVHGWVAAHERMRAMRLELGLVPIPPSSAATGTTEYMRFAGGYGVTVECGQHQAEKGPQTGYEAVLCGLVHLGMIRAPANHSAQRNIRALEIIEPILALHENDSLLRVFYAGEPVVSGKVIGRRHDGTDIVVPYHGAIIFASRTAAAGTELCFLCRSSARF